MSDEMVCDLCGETAGVRVYDDDGTALCPAHVPVVFATTARRNKALTAALDAATARLDHYRGTCQRCGRDGVLLDFIAEYDGMESICLEDREECDRLHEEQATRANEAFRARVAAGDPLAVMTDNFNRSMLEMSRRLPRPMLDDFKPGGIVQFATSNFAPTTEDAEPKED